MSIRMKLEIDERERRKHAEAVSSEPSLSPAPATRALRELGRRLGNTGRGLTAFVRGRDGLREADQVTRHEDPSGDWPGGDFPVEDYLWTPDKSDSSGWWGLLTSVPGGPIDADAVRAAVQALDSGDPAVLPISIPEDELPTVLSRLAKAWRASIDEPLPPLLTEEALAFARLGVPLKGITATARGRERRRF